MSTPIDPVNHQHQQDQQQIFQSPIKPTISIPNIYYSISPKKSKVVDLEQQDDVLSTPITSSTSDRPSSTYVKSSSSSMMSRFWTYIDRIRIFNRKKVISRRKKSSNQSNDVACSEPLTIATDMKSTMILRSPTQEMSNTTTPLDTSSEPVTFRFTPRRISKNVMVDELSSHQGVHCNIVTTLDNIYYAIQHDHLHANLSVDWMLSYEDDYLTMSCLHRTYPTILSYITRKIVQELSSSWKQFSVFACFRRDIDAIHTSRSALEMNMRRHGVNGRLCVSIRYSQPRRHGHKMMQPNPDSDLMMYDDMGHEVQLRSLQSSTSSLMKESSSLSYSSSCLSSSSSMNVIMSLLDLVGGGYRMIELETSSSTPSEDTSLEYLETCGQSNMDVEYIFRDHDSEACSIEFWIPSIVKQREL